MQEARYYEALNDTRVRCLLCPHGCVINDGKRGICQVRLNQKGKLYAATYAEVTSVNMDPIEKKPLYHFHPGRSILSIGTYGCNFRCGFCQNWQISQQITPTEHLESAAAVDIAERDDSLGLAYTYNEPLMWFEYIFDTAKLARQRHLKNVLVTNGYINQEPLAELMPYIDALNVDLKSIDDKFYSRLCGGRLEPVLETLKFVKDKAHLEITTLIIPGENDSSADIEKLAQWIADNVGRGTPLHLSAYFPAYKMNTAATDGFTLLKARKICIEHLDYVYLGNIAHKEGSDTVCANCGARLISRRGYSVSREENLGNDGRCKSCGHRNNIVV